MSASTMSDTEIAAVLEDDQVPGEHVSERVDPEAPYGRNPRTGKPYTMPPEQRAELGARLAESRRRAGSGGARKSRSPRKRATAAGAPSAPGTDYVAGVRGLLQLPAFALAFAGRFRPTLLLDSATITLHADTVAQAVAATATEQQWLADVLDKALAIGPYGALLGALIPVGMQIAANHGRIPPNAEMGILTPDELMASLGSGDDS